MKKIMFIFVIFILIGCNSLSDIPTNNDQNNQPLKNICDEITKPSAVVDCEEDRLGNVECYVFIDGDSRVTYSVYSYNKEWGNTVANVKAGVRTKIDNGYKVTIIPRMGAEAPSGYLVLQRCEDKKITITDDEFT